MRIISYIEPIPGLTRTGALVDCSRTIQISENDVCAIMRYTLSQNPTSNKCMDLASLSDKELVNEFIAVHWAEIIEQEEKKYDLSDR